MLGDTKPKFEIKYWFEPFVVYSAKGFFGRFSHTFKRRLNFYVFEAPHLYLVPAWVKEECHSRFEKSLR